MTQYVTLPLTFEPSAFGREVARLGAIAIGEIAPHPGGRQVQAWARLSLPDMPKQFLPATSMEKAREIVRAKVGEWIEAAGLRA